MLSAIEPIPTAIMLAASGALMAASALISRRFDRWGVPILLLFLVLGMLAGSDGVLGFVFEDYALAFRLGAAALVVILWDGGFNTRLSTIRAVLGPASVLATVGVVMTAGLLACAGRLLGFSWPEALLIGAAVSSTDAAAVFGVLRGGGVRLKRRVGATIEVESGVNDPMAVILIIAITSLVAGQSGSAWGVVWGVAQQLALGAIAGAVFGWVLARLLSRVRLQTAGMHPVLTLGSAFLCFGVTTIVGGSGFLAVYLCAAIVGGARLPQQAALTRVHDAAAWLAQTGMFLMLGLLAFPSRLPDVLWQGIGLAMLLAVVARPIACLICLAPFRLPWREISLISWVGLRGAVPIILATYPALVGAPGAERVFDAVFFIVVVSALIPGATIRPVARLLKCEAPEEPIPAAVLDINATQPLSGELLSYHITPPLAVAGVELSKVPFPKGSAAALLVRGSELIACRGDTVLLPGDHVYIFCTPEGRGLIELLFGRAQQEQD